MHIFQFFPEKIYGRVKPIKNYHDLYKQNICRMPLAGMDAFVFANKRIADLLVAQVYPLKNE